MKVTEEQLRLLIKTALIQEAKMSRRSIKGSSIKIGDKHHDEFSEEENSEFFPMTSKDINDVDDSNFSDRFRTTVKQIMSELEKKNFQPILGSAYRSPEEQKEKIDKGYSKTKTVYGYHVALNEKGEKSALAVDLVDKRYNWGEGSNDIKLGAEQFFKALGEICHSPTFKTKVTWGGDWEPKTFTVSGETFTRGWDPAHIQTKAVTMEQSAERTKLGLEKLKSEKKPEPKSSTSAQDAENKA